MRKGKIGRKLSKAEAEAGMEAFWGEGGEAGALAAIERWGSKSSNTAFDYGIDIDNLNFSNTVLKHLNRTYQESKLLINSIIESKSPIPDPRGTNVLCWNVEGTYNGSIGNYDLVIDPETNTVWHFVFKSYR